MYWFEIPDLDIDIEQLTGIVQSEDFRLACAKWEHASRYGIYVIPADPYTKVIENISRQFNLKLRPLIFVSQVGAGVHPHVDRNRFAAINIPLDGNFEEDPTLFFDKKGNLADELRYEKGKAYCVNVGLPHSGQCRSSTRRALLTLSTPIQFTFEEVFGFHKDGKLIAQEQTRKFFLDPNKPGSFRHRHFPKLDLLRSELERALPISKDFELYSTYGTDTVSTDHWFVICSKPNSKDPFFFSSHLNHMIFHLEEHFKVDLTGLFQKMYA